MQATHISPFSGVWYPIAAAELRSLLDEKFQESRQRTGPYFPGGALAFVVPHAGPQYSGTVAAAVYRAIQEQKPDRIIVLAFPHRGGLSGVASPDVERIATPLGEVEIERLFDRAPESRVCDHSFEIQLPFLQIAAPGARIAPLYVGRMTAAERQAAASRLAAEWRPGTVFLASSDFTHYGRDFDYVPFPPDRNIAMRLEELDTECIDAAGSLDSELFREVLQGNGATVCGTAPIALLQETLRILDGETIYQSLLDYQTSGDITGDHRNSVSYAALGYYRRAAFELDKADRESLLDAAAATLIGLRRNGVREPVGARGGSDALQGRRGVFVSLHHGEELLGCLGNCSGLSPLALEAPELTLSAALEDPRFTPAADFSGTIDIEISVLTPMKRIRDESSFCIGRHGALLRYGSRTGLLLPQVAEGREWKAEDFLKAVARKTGLGPQAWREPKARLYVFEAQVFGRTGVQ